MCCNFCSGLYYASEKGVSDSFDLIVRGLELTSGGIRTTSKSELVRKMKKDRIDSIRYMPYLNLFNGEIPTHGGFAIGVERIIAKYLNLPDVNMINPFGKKPNTTGEDLRWN